MNAVLSILVLFALIGGAVGSKIAISAFLNRKKIKKSCCTD